MKTMTTKGILFAALALMSVSFTADAGKKLEKANDRYYKQQVVYHINNIDSANGALRNVKNHLNALGDENIEVIVVTHSSGAFALVNGSKDSKGNTFEDTVQTLANRGVQFRICANTIRGKKIPKDKLNLNAEVIPSGVAEVAHLQQLGYMYVKP